MDDAVALGALLAAGVVAGWINTLAGAGSVVAVPALMFWGLPADVTNGTVRIAVVAQSATGLAAFRRAGRLPGQGMGAAIVPPLLGALAGAEVATHLPNRVFEPVLLGTMAVMAVALLIRPDSLAPQADEEPRAPGVIGVLSLFAAGFYGGLLQAGVGLILLAVLAGLLRHDLVAANALKVAITLAFNLVALAVFVADDLVRWTPGLVMAAGNVVGAMLGVRFALRRGQDAVRKVVVVAVLLSCLWLWLK